MMAMIVVWTLADRRLTSRDVIRSGRYGDHFV